MSSSPTSALSWVVGRGGLLGSHTETALAERGSVWTPATGFDWSSPRLHAQLETAVVDFAAATTGRRWQVAWCAGAGVVASTAQDLALDTAALETLLSSLQRAITSRLLGDGAFFFASSAGGLYAGSADPPFDESSAVRPLAPYGHTKLQQEVMVTDWAIATNAATVVGRIANLYGPGQHLEKPQGLISQLCRAHLRRQPVSIYVPLDTIRDYLFAPDCGRMVAAAFEQLGHDRPAARGAAPTVKVMASQRGITVGSVLSELKRVGKRPPLVSPRASEIGRFQVRDLRLRSIAHPELDRYASTPFPAGLNATYADLRRRQAQGRL